MQPDEVSARTDPISGTRAGAVAARGAIRVRAISVACAGLAGLIGLVGLSGWVFSVPVLTRILPGLATMKTDTALMLVLIALAGLTRMAQPLLSTVSALIALLISAATVAEYALRTNLGIDQLLFTDHGGSAHPGRPSLATALCALLLAGAALRPAVRRTWLVETLTLAVFAAAFLALLGYLYGVHSLYEVGPYASVAVNTAAALLLLSITGLGAAERGVLVWLVAARKPGATLMRIVVPGSLIVLPLGGYLCVEIESQGWASGDALLAINVVFCIAVLIAASWLAGVRLDRVDRKRKRVLAELNAITDDLEAQVAERSEQLRKGHDQVLLLAERQRIAADLHDVVVQRLFAAGMTLNSVDPASVEASVGRRIDNAVESMDAAILDLRSSIFELSRSPAGSSDLISALDTLCVEAARVLRFEPDLTVDDPDDEAAAVRSEILAITREALSNVAKHARASSVQVVIRVDDTALSLVVTDDGVGLTTAPHSSGTQNMRDRAERLGGSCTWSAVAPHGTRVRWTIPRASVEPPARARGLTQVAD